MIIADMLMDGAEPDKTLAMAQEEGLSHVLQLIPHGHHTQHDASDPTRTLQMPGRALHEHNSESGSKLHSCRNISIAAYTETQQQNLRAQ